MKLSMRKKIGEFDNSIKGPFERQNAESDYEPHPKAPIQHPIIHLTKC